LRHEERSKNDGRVHVTQDWIDKHEKPVSAKPKPEKRVSDKKKPGMRQYGKPNTNHQAKDNNSKVHPTVVNKTEVKENKQVEPAKEIIKAEPEPEVPAAPEVQKKSSYHFFSWSSRPPPAPIERPSIIAARLAKKESAKKPK